MKFVADSTALAWRDAKTASLYFDYVVPALWSFVVRRGSPSRSAPDIGRVVEEILPPGLALLPASSNDLLRSLRSLDRKALSKFLKVSTMAVDSSEVQGNIREILDKLTRIGVDDCAVFGEPLGKAKGDDNATPCLMLSNLNLLDARKLTWEQILAFRRDTESVKKLRRLRRFVFKKYSGKPQSYIREDIEERIDQYKEATRFWGFPTAAGLLKIGLNVEVAAALGTVSMALFGAPLAAAAAAGAAAAVGNGLLEIGLRKREIKLERERNPMAYLAEIRSASGK